MSNSIARTDLPSDMWDSHMHIIDPECFPLSSEAKYVPQPHTFKEAMAFESSIGCKNIVLVQPSIYGFDNSCLLESLREIGSQHGRGVVGISPQVIIPETVEAWHSLGVRGARVNLQSVDKRMSPEELVTELGHYKVAVGPWDWVLQLYIPLDNVPALVDFIPESGMRVCFDHFACPKLPSDLDPNAEFDPYSLTGFTELVSLLKQGNTYVKLSAAYRLSDDPEFKHLGIIAKELMRVAPDRLVFASDWPHTRFEGMDIAPFINKCLEWCGNDRELVEKLFRLNAERLWNTKKTN